MDFDTTIVGGSFAGLSASLYLARARRSVLVLDTGAPRNRFATASHGFFAQDASNPMVMLKTIREQVAAYPTVQFRDQRALDAAHEESGFRVTLEFGQAVSGAKLLLASGISEILPALPGLAERWGKTVIHCPYCHGYEFRGQRLGVLNLSTIPAHQASMIAEWRPTTFFLNGGPIEPELTAELEQRGVTIEPAPLYGLLGEGTNFSAIRLRSSVEQPLDALLIGPRSHFNSEIAEKLGYAIEDGPLGSVVTLDEMTATNIAGVYAAGDITRMEHTVTFTCADGVMAALAIHRALAFGG